MARLALDSVGRPCSPEGLDLSLLVDGLTAEREQGITIDVAYRYFATPRRSFIVADSPGHVQYTANMATAASNAEAAILLVDAQKGLSPQTRRHIAILGLFGIRHVAAAINKMDVVGYASDRFEALARELAGVAARAQINHLVAIPVSALLGDNVVRPYPDGVQRRGPTLLEWLESVEPHAERHQLPFRMPVQWVNWAGADFRGFSGRVISGTIRQGDAVSVAGTSQQSSVVSRIVTMEDDLQVANAGQSVTLVLKDQIDVSRGDVIADVQRRPTQAGQFAATLLWLSSEPLALGRRYDLRIGTRTTSAVVTALRYRLDTTNLEREQVEALELNEIGSCDIAVAAPVSIDPFAMGTGLGSFILVDRLTRETVGAGVVSSGMSTSGNVKWQHFRIGREARARLKKHGPAIVWLTGLSGAGKSTISNLVDSELTALGYHSYVLDGDNLRHGLNKDLGFSAADRIENMRRAAEVAALLADAGHIVIVSLIAPFRQERSMARAIAQELPFLEVFVDAPLEVCVARDPKGLYRRARAGEIRDFTGIDSPYEPPLDPDLHLRTDQATASQLAQDLTALIIGRVEALPAFPSV